MNLRALLRPLLTHALGLIVGIDIGQCWKVIDPPSSPSPTVEWSAATPAPISLPATLPEDATIKHDRPVLVSDLATAWQNAVTTPARQVVLADAARINPELALHWLVQHPEAASTDTLRLLVPRLSLSTPAAASPWIDSLPKDLRATALQALIHHWSAKNPTASAQLIERYRELPGHDQRVGAFALAVGRLDPTTAIQWSRTLADPHLRSSTQAEILKNWLHRNPLAAMRWLDSTPDASEAEKSLWQDCAEQLAISAD